MYVIIRKFNHMRSVPEAARRAESGIGQMLKQSPGFQGYYVFDAGNGIGCEILLLAQLQCHGDGRMGGAAAWKLL